MTASTMLIGITGPICSGKHTTAEYLVQHHGFLRLHLPTPSQLQPAIAQHLSTTNGASGTSRDDPFAHLLPSVTDQKGTRGLTFPDVDSLLEFVTKRWREHWVLTDIYDEATLELLLRRPFFMLLNVEAPVGVRYQRFSERYVVQSTSPLSGPSVNQPCFSYQGMKNDTKSERVVVDSTHPHRPHTSI